MRIESSFNGVQVQCSITFQWAPIGHGPPADSGAGMTVFVPPHAPYGVRFHPGGGDVAAAPTRVAPDQPATVTSAAPTRVAPDQPATVTSVPDGDAVVKGDVYPRTPSVAPRQRDPGHASVDDGDSSSPTDWHPSQDADHPAAEGDEDEEEAKAAAEPERRESCVETPEEPEVEVAAADEPEAAARAAPERRDSVASPVLKAADEPEAASSAAPERRESVPSPVPKAADSSEAATSAAPERRDSDKAAAGSEAETSAAPERRGSVNVKQVPKAAGIAIIEVASESESRASHPIAVAARPKAARQPEEVIMPVKRYVSKPAPPFHPQWSPHPKLRAPTTGADDSEVVLPPSSKRSQPSKASSVASTTTNSPLRLRPRRNHQGQARTHQLMTAALKCSMVLPQPVF